MGTDEPSALLAWYDRHGRDLPWRRTRDPYRIWLSEVMLQQTQVETVLPYYQRFLDRFPTLGDLAMASEEDVLALWSGLGYYRRARQLHEAAREVLRGGGALPKAVDGLLELPGIGPYTAAAIASIAFAVPVPVLDGNVERVIARMLAFPGDPKSARGRETLLGRASELIDRHRPGDSNQALMELGATLCRPQRPRCPLCPLRTGCQGAAAGHPERYPPPRKRRAVERVRRATAVVRPGEGDERILLFRRPAASDLLPGTWELPWVDLPEDAMGGEESTTRALAAERLGQRYGGRWSLGRWWGQVRHGITHRRLQIEVYDGRLSAPSREVVAEGAEAGWFAEAERLQLPKSSLMIKALGLLAAPPS